jgi:hypothetical protein
VRDLLGKATHLGRHGAAGGDRDQAAERRQQRGARSEARA